MSIVESKETIEFVARLTALAISETKIIIARLQEQRFANDGAFNDHPKWAPNVREDILFEKGYKPVLQDTGELKSELTNPDNWDVEVEFSNNKLTLTIPEEEEFTDPKYDSLEDTDGGEYYGTKTGKKIKYKSKPAREFKKLSDQDVQWIADQLEIVLREKLA